MFSSGLLLYLTNPQVQKLTLTGQCCGAPGWDSGAVLVETHKSDWFWKQNPPPCPLMGKVTIAMMYAKCAEGKLRLGQASGVDHI